MIRGASAIILAGGAGRRFGGDKALAAWQDETLIQHQVKLYRSFFPSVIVVTRNEKAFSFLGGRDVNVARDLFPERHALGGLYSGLQRVTTEYAFVSACDMPFPSFRLIEALWNIRIRRDRDPAMVPVWNGILQPLFAFYSKGTLETMKQLIDSGEFRLQSLLERIHTRVLEEGDVKALDSEGLSFLDIDTPEDHERARRLARTRAY